MPRFPVFFLAALVALAMAGACSGDGDGAGTARSTAGHGTAAEPAGHFAVTVLSTDVQAMAPQAPPFPDDVKAAVTASLEAWLAKGVVGPLRAGTPPAGLEAVFTEPALARLAVPGPDRAAVLEEGSPLKGAVRQERANARLTALTAPGGDVALVTVQLDLAHVVEAGGASVAVVRSGEVVLVPSGGWRIDAYDVRTSRDTVPG
ncbi:MAG: hypothetical protein ACT4PX_09020 [Actinomycetota bacterium]